MPFKDETIPIGEQWFYELDGRAHGPMRWSDLEELLDRAGDTAFQVRVRKGADGPWSAFRSRGQTSPLSVEQSPDARLISHRKSGSLANFFGLHRDVCVGVGVWILLNLLFFLFWPKPYAKERRYLATLQDVVREADELRSSGATGAEWGNLEKRTKERLAPMIADLQKSANSSELPRQQLLWSARDLAPKIMGAKTREREENELRMKRYLESVEQALR